MWTSASSSDCEIALGLRSLDKSDERSPSSFSDCSGVWGSGVKSEPSSSSNESFGNSSDDSEGVWFLGSKLVDGPGELGGVPYIELSSSFTEAGFRVGCLDVCVRFGAPLCFCSNAAQL